MASGWRKKFRCGGEVRPGGGPPCGITFKVDLDDIEEVSGGWEVRCPGCGRGVEVERDDLPYLISHSTMDNDE